MRKCLINSSMIQPTVKRTTSMYLLPSQKKFIYVYLHTTTRSPLLLLFALRFRSCSSFSDIYDFCGSGNQSNRFRSSKSHMSQFMILHPLLVQMFRALLHREPAEHRQAEIDDNLERNFVQTHVPDSLYHVPQG